MSDRRPTETSAVPSFLSFSLSLFFFSFKGTRLVWFALRTVASLCAVARSVYFRHGHVFMGGVANETSFSRPCWTSGPSAVRCYSVVVPLIFVVAFIRSAKPLFFFWCFHLMRRIYNNTSRISWSECFTQLAFRLGAALQRFRPFLYV